MIIEFVALLIAILGLLVTYIAIANQNKPQIIIYYYPNPHQASIIDLVVENIGSGLAFDIKFSVQLLSKLWGIATPDPSEKGITIFENGIPYLAAGQKICAYGGQYAGIRNWIGNGKSITLTAKYKNPLSFTRKTKSKCFLSVNHLKDLPTRTSGEQAIVNAFNISRNSGFFKINNEIKRLGNLVEKLINSRDKS